MIDVVMPKMGESITEGTILEWKKKIGDSIGKDEPLLEISTDKVDSEIPSRFILSSDNGTAAKTVPTGKPSAKTQALSIASQKTDAQPPSSVLATAQSKPPLIRGSIISSVGDFSSDFSFRSIGSSRQKSRLCHISNDYNDIYNVPRPLLD